jgi:hypothetical protein
MLYADFMHIVKLIKPKHTSIAVILKSAGAARVLEITSVVLEYCLNQIFVEIIMEYDVK